MSEPGLPKQMKRSKDDTQNKIQPVKRDGKAKEAVGEDSGLDWDTITTTVDEYDAWLGESMRYALWLTGLDGIALEFSLSAEASTVVGLKRAHGLSILFPLHSEYDPGENEQAPIADSPHWYLFGATGVDVGPQAGASLGAEAQVLFATHWGGAEYISRQSWGGTVISLDASGAAELGLGGELDVTAYFTSIAPTEYGLLPYKFPKRGWQGVGVGASLGGGAEVKLSIGLTLVGTSERILESNPVVREAMQKSGEDIPRVDHYRRPETGPDTIHSLIETMADWTGPKIKQNGGP